MSKCAWKKKELPSDWKSSVCPNLQERRDKWEGGIGIGGSVVANLRYADDTTLIAGTKEDLIEIMERVRKKARKRDSIYEGHDYRIYWRGDSGREHRGVCIEFHLSRSSKVSKFIHNKPSGFNDTSESNQQDKYSLDTNNLASVFILNTITQVVCPISQCLQASQIIGRRRVPSRITWFCVRTG